MYESILIARVHSFFGQNSYEYIHQVFVVQSVVLSFACFMQSSLRFRHQK